MTSAQAIMIVGFLQAIIMVAEELNVPCENIIKETQSILEQYPELWATIDEPVEKLLKTA